MPITNVERVQKTTAAIEAAGIIDKQFGFSTDDLRIVCRNGDNYYHIAGLSSPTNAFTGAMTVGTTLGVTGVTTLTDDLIVDTDTLFVDASTDRVGIGTASPNYSLEVKGASNSQLGLVATDSSPTTIVMDTTTGATDRIRFKNDAGELKIAVQNTTDAVTIDTSGKVGIGTTSPNSPLEVESTSGNIITATGTTGNASIEVNTSAVVNSIANFNLQNDTIQWTSRVDGSDSDSFKILDSVGGDRFTIDTSGNVGIGTTSPSEILHIESSGTPELLVKSTGASLDPSLMLQNDAILWRVQAKGSVSDNFTIRDSTNNADRLVIDTSGNIGIGTTSPAELLDIRGNVSITNSSGKISLDTNDNTGSILESNFDRTAAGASGFIVRGQWDGTVVGDMTFLTGTDTTNKDDGEIRFRVAEGGTLAEAMRIAQDGKVGIGTTAPSDAGSTYGNLTLNGTAGGALSFTDDDVLKARIQSGVDDFILTAADASGTMQFRVGGTSSGDEAMRIDASGNVGIGTASPDSESKLHIYKGASGQNSPQAGSDELIIENNADAGISILTTSSDSGYITFGDESDAGRARIRFDHPTDRMIISADGNADLSLDGSGALELRETSTPTALTNYGKVYCKNDNKLYFQDGAGTEHEVAFV